MDDEKVEEFLSHYGVKGMRWGVRRHLPGKVRRAKVQAQRAKLYDDHANRLQKRIDKIDEKPAKSPLARQNQAKRKAQLEKQRDRAARDAERKREGRLSSDDVRRIAKGAAVAGVLVLLFAPTMKVNNMPKPSPKVKQTVADIVRQERDKQAYSLKRMFDEGHMDKDQYANFSKALEKRYAKKIADAMKEGLS